jgi:hypothetical protein
MKDRSCRMRECLGDLFTAPLRVWVAALLLFTLQFGFVLCLL